MTEKRITIIGAGLVGSLLGIYLAKKGHRVSMYERRPDMRKEAISAGRSINLALSDRGINALKEVGIADDILAIAIPMHGRFIHNLDGSNAFQPYGKEGQSINSVSRGELNGKLMSIAEKHGIEIFFNKKCAQINWNENEVIFDDAFTEVKHHVQSDIIFAADGAYSTGRLQHMLAHEKFDYEQHFIDCGYKELAIPAGAGGNFQLEKHALHIWPRKDYMLIALPNLDGSFTCTLFFPFEGEHSFKNLDTREKVIDFFQRTFPETLQLIPDLAEQFERNPISSLVTVKCFPWIRGEHFALIGDAAHAIVPFFGQGMNCGFEDCSVLNNLMEKHGDNWTELLTEFQELRKPDTDAIADMAINNFVEMRAKTADPSFLLQKKIEARLHDKYPDKWIPAYSQVTFSPQIRYSDALKSAQRQESIMQGVMQMPEIQSKWDSAEIEEFILSRLNKLS